MDYRISNLRTDVIARECTWRCTDTRKRVCTESWLVSPFFSHSPHIATHLVHVPMGSPSRDGDVAVYVFDINQPSLPTPFYSVLVYRSIFMALSTVFHSMNSLDNSSLSHSVLPVLFLLYWSIQIYISVWKSPSALIWSFMVDWN